MGTNISINAFEKRTGWKVEDANHNEQLDPADRIFRPGESGRFEKATFEEAEQAFFDPKVVAKEFRAIRKTFREDCEGARGKLLGRNKVKAFSAAFGKLAGALEDVNPTFAAEVKKFKGEAEATKTWTGSVRLFNKASDQIEIHFADLLKDA